ncbi:hypothetical protein MHW47_05860 [Streptomyces sp. OfavH-34-F]|uniref:hypothetical protein n=1 Tax=Streptomyces sp. OfavH-34-F TaxID=2917760 RepID=UPI001EF3146C|nr:hypothetical protein [Streptomyces sp. OfavH-34-F]MCG7523966.1 hypothetical protein [Streptomyces sp. OfavH-34-F]
MPNRLAVIKTLQQDVLGNHRWDDRTRSYTTVPAEAVWAVEDAMAAILERVARAVDWPRLLLEATQRHEVLHPETPDSPRDWTPELGLCRECLVEALLSDQIGATNWITHPATPKEHDRTDWPSIVAAHLPHRASAAWHPYKEAPEDRHDGRQGGKSTDGGENAQPW